MSASLRVIKSSGLLLSLQLIQRGLGIVSTLILARLLLPEHFGVVALVMIALQFFELLVETGNQQYIIQKTEVSDTDLNTAWSMDISIKSAMCLVIIMLSVPIASFFDTPALAPALAVASVTLPIRALKTPGMMLLAREINYRPVFRLTLWQKLLSFATVVTWAFISPSHWAMIAGTVVSAVVFTIGSYRVHDFRPSWTLAHLGQQWRFSQWLLMRGIVGFTRSQIDNLMVSRWFGTTQLGGYNLVREVSLLPALSAIIPMTEPLLAAIAEGKKEADTLAFRVRLGMALLITVLTPITAFIMMYPELIVRVLLGPDWSEFAGLLRPFGLFFFTFCLFSVISDALIAQGRVKLLFWFDLLSTLIIIAVLAGIARESLYTMAWARGWLAVATTVLLLVILDRETKFSVGRLALLCLPAAAGTLFALSLTIALPLASQHFLVEFLTRGVVFVFSAAAATLVIAWLWMRSSEEGHQLRFLVKKLYSERKSA